MMPHSLRFAKKQEAEIKIKFQKMKDSFFGQHPGWEVTNRHILFKNLDRYLKTILS